MTWRLGDTSGPHVFLGASGTLRRNGDAWAAADYDAVGAKANFVWSPHAGLTLRAGALADARRFGEIPALDQVEGRGFASVLANLPSRTTLIGEVVPRREVLRGRDDPGAGRGPLRRDPGRRGRRERKGSGRDGARPASAGRVTARDRRATRAPASSPGSCAPRSRWASAPASRSSTRDAPSSAAVPPVVVTTPALFFEDGVYDDPYASDASAVRAVLKHVFAGGATAEIEGHWLDKAYVVHGGARRDRASPFRTGRSGRTPSGGLPPRRRCPSSAPAPAPSPSRSSSGGSTRATARTTRSTGTTRTRSASGSRPRTERRAPLARGAGTS